MASRRDELERALELVYYGARSSWVSQSSRPYLPSRHEVTGLSGFAARMVHDDLAKRIVPLLIAHRPDVVVFDLIAERRPLVRFGRSWVTTSDYLDRTTLGERALGAADEVSHLGQPRRARLFARAARTLARRLCRELPETVFVLNPSPYVTRIAGGEELPEPSAGWSRELQARQQPMFETLAAAFGGRLVRLDPPPRICLADPAHRWGLTSYHLVPQYHEWLIDRLLDLPGPDVPRRRRVVGRWGSARSDRQPGARTSEQWGNGRPEESLVVLPADPGPSRIDLSGPVAQPVTGGMSIPQEPPRD